jgi:hypothetical protein
MAKGVEPPSARGQKANDFGEDTDLDAGWDDEPAPPSAAPLSGTSVKPSYGTSPSAPSHRPTVGAPVPAALSALAAEVAAKPKPRSVGPSLVPVNASPRALAQRAEDAGTLRPSESEIEPSVTGTRRKGAARFVASIGIAAAMVLASLAWLKDGGQTVMERLNTVLAPAARPEPEPAQPPTPESPTMDAKLYEASLPPGAVITAVDPALAAPEAVPPPPPPMVTTEATGAPTHSGSVAATPAKPGTTRVTVKTVPSGAAIFQAGRRVGTGSVELEVEPKMKHRLTALLDGHRPVNFTVDGTRDTVTIMLRRVPSKPEASPPSDGSADSPETPATP